MLVAIFFDLGATFKQQRAHFHDFASTICSGLGPVVLGIILFWASKNEFTVTCRCQDFAAALLGVVTYKGMVALVTASATGPAVALTCPVAPRSAVKIKFLFHQYLLSICNVRNFVAVSCSVI